MNNKKELTALEALERFKLLYENKCKSPNNIIGFDVCYATIEQDLERLKELEEKNASLHTEIERLHNECECLQTELKRYRNLEQKIGIDLIPLLTVLTNGYAFWKYDNFIYKVQIESITNCCLKVNTWYYVNSNKNGKKYGGEFGIYFKDYGKTWSLDKQTLEK